jgi:hypothetical protein
MKTHDQSIDGLQDREAGTESDQCAVSRLRAQGLGLIASIRWTRLTTAMAQRIADGVHHRQHRKHPHDLHHRIDLGAFVALVRMRGDEFNGRPVRVDVEDGMDITTKDDSMGYRGTASTTGQCDRHHQSLRRRLCSASAV